MALVQSFASFLTSPSTQEAGGGPATRSSLRSGFPPKVKVEVKAEVKAEVNTEVKAEAEEEGLFFRAPPEVKNEVKVEEEEGGNDEERMPGGEAVVVKRGRGRPRGSTKHKNIEHNKAPPSKGLPLSNKRSCGEECVWPYGVVPLVRRVRLQFPCSVGFIYLLTQACTNDEGVFEKVKQLAQSNDVLGKKTRVKKVVLDKYPGQWA